MFLVLFVIFISIQARTPALSTFINLSRTTWTAQHYERWDKKSLETLKRYFNVMINENSDLEIKIHDKIELPTSFSSETAWSKCQSIKEIRDQSNCGSCWAVSAASTISDRLCINSGQSDQRRISADDILSCCGINCGYGCDGGFPEGAWKFLRTTGIVTGNSYNDYSLCRAYSFPPCSHGNIKGKYSLCDEDIFLSVPTPACTKVCHSQSGKIYTDDKIKSSSNPYTITNSSDQIMTEIYTYGPVQAVFTVYEDFLNYKSGVYQYVSGQELGQHAVKIVGWGEENGLKYWEVVNSWNDGWGLNGKFKILRGVNHLGIESHIYAGLV